MNRFDFSRNAFQTFDPNLNFKYKKNSPKIQMKTFWFIYHMYFGFESTLTIT